MLYRFLRERILTRFYKIELTDFERRMADDAIRQKYAPAVAATITYSILLIPALLLLDTGIVVSVLIPTTMVAGTAWFAVSLASMKKKFENFGMELTTHLFVAFTLSLSMLMLTTVVSLTAIFWQPYVPEAAKLPLPRLAAAVLAIFVVGKLVYSIFAGSLKYDINDAMLTGQNEAAERFFTKSLSLLHTTALELRRGTSLQLANYSLGLAFYEIFNNIRELPFYGTNALGDINDLLNRANQLIRNPKMSQEDADNIATSLATSFLTACSQRSEVTGHRSYEALEFELKCLTANKEEERQMVDTRMSVVFTEMSNLLETFGPSLFDATLDTEKSAA